MYRAHCVVIFAIAQLSCYTSPVISCWATSVESWLSMFICMLCRCSLHCLARCLYLSTCTVYALRDLYFTPAQQCDFTVRYVFSTLPCKVSLPVHMYCVCTARFTFHTCPAVWIHCQVCVLYTALQGVSTCPHVLCMHCEIYISHLPSSVISLSGMCSLHRLASCLYLSTCTVYALRDLHFTPAQQCDFTVRYDSFSHILPIVKKHHRIYYMLIVWYCQYCDMLFLFVPPFYYIFVQCYLLYLFFSLSLWYIWKF